MITLNLYIRLANSMEGAIVVEKSLKEDILFEQSRKVLETLEEDHPLLVKSSHLLIESKELRNLPSHLYWFRDYKEGPLLLCTEVTKPKINLPTVKSFAYYLMFGPELHPLSIELDIEYC